MSKLGLAFSGTLAALAFGAVAATALAQQPSPGPDGPRASPTAPEAGRDAGRMDRERRDWRDEEGRDRGPRSWRDRRDFDDFADRRRWRDDDRWNDRDREDHRRWREGRDRWHERGNDDRREFHHRGGMGMRALARLCRPGGDRMMGFLLDRLERITQPTDSQRASFDKLKEAAGKAHETVRAACPSEPRPITPPGRMAAAEKRLEALLAAVRHIRPALDEYYGSLSEEQKARLYAARGRANWRHGFDRWRDRDWERRGSDRPRRGSREDTREGSDNDRNRGDERGEDRDDRPSDRERWRSQQDGSRDGDRDGWPDRWRGPS